LEDIFLKYNILFFIDLPKYFLKQTFNFFGLKEKLGAENEGLAVILTKGIYYGLKKLFFGIANKFTLGGFSKLKNYLLKLKLYLK
jgi:hypothetical protein